MTRIKRDFGKIFSKLAAISLAICVIFYLVILNKSITAKTMMTLFTSSATVTLFLWLLWDKLLWKIRFIKRLDPVPNFSGRWEGYYQRFGSESDHKQHLYVLEIRQTYSSIQCSTYQDNGSKSAGVIAELCTLSNEDEGLIFYWQGISTDAEKDEDLPKEYRGVTVLTYSPPTIDGKAKFEGTYFTNRKTNGKVDVDFFSKNLQGRFNAAAVSETPVAK
ncbi:MAG: hypothetical protein E7456_06085 [Ruminococcaceae bacterium]|nr:hypothetical protein [Oscillospiraceae bacterium]